jgi:hypothetical protein
MSMFRIIQFVSVLFTSLALAPALAHLMELPNKLRLSREAYLTVQRIYRGWQLVGIVVVAALVSTLLLLLQAGDADFLPALVALLCIVATQVVFWSVTFPVNRRTQNWTVVPENWTPLRNRWEYSHALSAALNLVAVVSVTVAVLVEKG